MQSKSFDGGRAAVERLRRGPLDDIVGLPAAKAVLWETSMFPLVFPASLFCGARKLPKCVLLYGPPGTGKTMLAGAIAAASGRRLFSVTPSSVLSKWAGEGEKALRRVFAEAVRGGSPAVIFFDEIDALAGTRNGPAGEDIAARRLLSELLILMTALRNEEFEQLASRAGAGGGASSVRSTGGMVEAERNSQTPLRSAAASPWAGLPLEPAEDGSVAWLQAADDSGDEDSGNDLAPAGAAMVDTAVTPQMHGCALPSSPLRALSAMPAIGSTTSASAASLLTTVPAASRGATARLGCRGSSSASTARHAGLGGGIRALDGSGSRSAASGLRHPGAPQPAGRAAPPSVPAAGMEPGEADGMPVAVADGRAYAPGSGGAHCVPSPASAHRPDVIIIAATNRIDDCDEALLRRFDRRVECPLPDDDQRLQLLQQLLHGIDVEPFSPDQLAAFAAATHGWSCSDVSQLASEAVMEPMRESLYARLEAMWSGDATAAAAGSSIVDDDAPGLAAGCPEEVPLVRAVTWADFESAFLRIVPSSEAAARHTHATASPMLAPSLTTLAPFHLASGASTAGTPVHEPGAAPVEGAPWSSSGGDADADGAQPARLTRASTEPADPGNEAMQRGARTPASATSGSAWPPAASTTPAQLLVMAKKLAVISSQARPPAVSARASLTRLASTPSDDSDSGGASLDSDDEL